MITTQTLLASAGPLAGDYEIRMLEAAMARAATFLDDERGGAIMGSTTQHHDAIEALARELDDDIAKHDALLDTFKARRDGGLVHHAADVATDRWAPVVAMAFYFGLAIALHLAAATDGPTSRGSGAR